MKKMKAIKSKPKDKTKIVPTEKTKRPAVDIAVGYVDKKRVK